MLREISIKDIKLPSNDTYILRERLKFDEIDVKDEVLEYFILNDPQIQIAALSLFNADTRWFEFTLPKETSLDDILVTPSFQVLNSLFYEIKGGKATDYYQTLMVKRITRKTRSLLNKMVVQKKINSEITSLIKNDDFRNFKPENMRIYQVIYDYSITKEMLTSYKKNMLDKMVKQQLNRNDSLYAFFIQNLSIEMINNNQLIQALSYFYPKVYVVGFGDPWMSDEVIVSEFSLKT